MKIDIKGIVRNTPAVNAKDGELDEVINLRPKDGAWRPIPARSAIFSGLQYTNVYVHSNSGYKHYLGLKSTGEFEYFAEDIDGVPTELPVPILVTMLSNPTFTQIGNVININDTGLKHLVWYDGAYVVINSDFDGEQDDLNLICNSIEFKVDEVTDNNGHREMVTYFTDALFKYDDFADANKVENLNARKESAKAIMIKALGKEASEGYLHGYFLACTAIELYDGSFIQHSNPVLLGHVHDTGLRYSGLVIDNVSRSYNGNKASFNVENTNRVPDEDGRYIEHVDTVKAYVAYNSGEKYINTRLNPGLIATFRYIGTQSILAPNHDQQVWVSVMRNKLSYKVKNSFSEYLRPLIKSISLFITPQVQLYDLTDVKRSTNIKYDQSTDGVTNLDLILENFSGNIKENGTIIKELGESKVFYKVHEIPFDDIVAGTWQPVDLKDKLGDLLYTQEKLDYDNFSHHQLLPEVQFVYNSKLHIGDYKTVISRGFPIPSFNYNAGVGQFDNNLYKRLVSGYIEVSLKMTNGDTKVVRSFNKYDTVIAYSGALNQMLSYPDNRAYKMKLFIQVRNDNGSFSYMQKEFKLTASDSHNFAYYIDPDLLPISDYTTSQTLIPFVLPDEINREQVFSNTIKVSEINNPFIFPVENTYQVGNGNIIALATNTIALSTGQFGEYPVYVFCSDGIYALNVGGGEVNYSSSRPVSREVCVNKHVKSVDYGVVFMTSRGACIISGAEVREISEPLRGDYFDVNKTAQFKKRISHNQLVQLLPEITGESIADFMKDAVIGYNYMDKEVWFTNPNKSYSYVFSRGVWFKAKQTGQLYVDDYPKQYILNSGDLIDIASETGTATETAFLTRPMKMGDNFKQLFTAIIRSTLIVEDKYKIIGQNYYKIIGQNYVIDYLKYAGIYVFGSYDGQRWGFIGGCEKRSEINDLGTRVERTDCKYFRVGFVGNIKNESTIQFMEFEGGKSILADKIR